MKKRIVTVLLILLLSQLLAPIGFAAESASAAEEPITIRAAALLPLSGALASKGENHQAAIALSVADVNRQWRERGVPMQLDLTVRDSGSNPETALESARKLYDEGIRIFVAGSSAEVELLKPWADENGSVIVSYNSTSPALAAAGDSVFRMVPDDSNQAKALAELLVKENIHGIVPVYRNDVYGQQLFKHLQEEFALYYGLTADAVVYEPDEDDWDKVAGDIAAQLQQLEILDENKAVVILSFDEAVPLLAKSEQLGEIRWFGGDTVALSPAILADAAAADRAAAGRLTAVTFGMPELPLAESIRLAVSEQTQEAFIPDALFAYDALGLLANAIEQLDDPLDAGELRDKLVDLSGSYEGATGWTLLDENGDRKYYHYDVWQVQPAQPSAQTPYEWELIMKYTRNPGAPGYLVPVASEPLEHADVQSYLFGYPDSPQDLERYVSRAEFTYMLVNALGWVDGRQPLPATFADAENIDERATSAVQIAVQEGIVSGYTNGTFQPDSVITLAESLVMMSRALDDLGYPLPADASSSAEIEAPAWAKAHIVHVLEQEGFAPDVTLDYGSTPLTLGDASLLIINLMKRSVQN